MTTERGLILVAVAGVVLYALWAMMGWVVSTLKQAMRQMHEERRAAEREAAHPARERGF